MHSSGAADKCVSGAHVASHGDHDCDSFLRIAQAQLDSWIHKHPAAGKKHKVFTRSVGSESIIANSLCLNLSTVCVGVSVWKCCLGMRHSQQGIIICAENLKWD